MFRFSIRELLLVTLVVGLVLGWWLDHHLQSVEILVKDEKISFRDLNLSTLGARVEPNDYTGEHCVFTQAQPSIPVSTPTVQVLFNKPEGMQVRWDAMQLGAFDSTPLIVPGRQSFPQNAIYRLKITNLEKAPGMELYPTIEIGPTTPRSEDFVAHNAIPLQFTDEDLDQVMAGNFVTKVVYLPDPEFQELALAGVDTLVSTQLDPGVDPITEADRRGVILAIIRLGNKDLELPDTGH